MAKRARKKQAGSAAAKSRGGHGEHAAAPGGRLCYLGSR